MSYVRIDLDIYSPIESVKRLMDTYSHLVSHEVSNLPTHTQILVFHRDNIRLQVEYIAKGEQHRKTAAIYAEDINHVPTPDEVYQLVFDLTGLDTGESWRSLHFQMSPEAISRLPLIWDHSLGHQWYSFNVDSDTVSTREETGHWSASVTLKDRDYIGFMRRLEAKVSEN